MSHHIDPISNLNIRNRGLTASRKEEKLDMFGAWPQYSSALRLISSEDHKNFTSRMVFLCLSATNRRANAANFGSMAERFCDVALDMSMPVAFQTSIKYLTWILGYYAQLPASILSYHKPAHTVTYSSPKDCASLSSCKLPVGSLCEGSFLAGPGLRPRARPVLLVKRVKYSDPRGLWLLTRSPKLDVGILGAWVGISCASNTSDVNCCIRSACCA